MRISTFRDYLSALLVLILLNYTSAIHFAQETTSQSQQSSAYEDLYKQFFGKAPSQEESVEIPVNLFVDLQPVANIIILSDTFSKWYKVSKKDFSRFIIPRLTPAAQSSFQKALLSIDGDWIETEWLVERGFRLDYITIDQYLEIRIPPAIKGVQEIDLSKKPGDNIEISLTSIQPNFFSAYSNIDYRRTYTDNEEITDETATDNEVVEYDNDLTLKNHLALGDFFLENQMNFSENAWSYDQLYVSTVRDASILKVGFLDTDSLAGVQAENVEINQFLNRTRKFKPFIFSAPDGGFLNVKINRSTVYKQKIFPGTYKLTHLPVKTGDNDVHIKVIDKKRNIVYEKEFYTYISNEHLPQYSLDYDVKYAFYDSGEGNMIDRVQNFPFTMLSNSVGLGSLFNKYAMTLQSQWNKQEYQDWKAFTLKTALKQGRFDSTFSVSRTEDYKRGYYAAGSFQPSKAFLKKINQSAVLFNVSIQNGSYMDFSISPYVPTPGSAGGFYTLNTSFSILNDRPITLTYEKYFSGEYTGRIVTGFSKKGRFWELSSNVALQFSETETTPFVFFKYLMNFQKSGATAEVAYQPGSEPEISYGAPYMVADTPVNVVVSPEKQSVGFSKGKNENVLSMDFNTDNEFTAKVDGTNSRSSYGYSYRKKITSDSASSFTATNIYLSTAVMMAGNKVAVSRPVNNNTFLVASSHEFLQSTDVKIDEDLEIDYLGSAGVYYLKPSAMNTIKIKPDMIPHNVIIENDNIEFTPEYGKGYQIEIGKPAPVVLIGRIINKKGEPEDLVYGKINWEEGSKTFFTNQRGMFQTTLEETNVNYTIELVDHPGKSYEFFVPEDSSGVINLKSFSVKPNKSQSETQIKEESSEETTKENTSVSENMSTSPNIQSKVSSENMVSSSNINNIMPTKDDNPIGSLDSIEFSKLNLKVEVLNGIGKKGVAQIVARQLKQEGVLVARIDNAGNFDYKETKLVDWRGDSEGAKALALLLNISDDNIISYKQKDKTIGFSLVIGQDWQEKERFNRVNLDSTKNSINSEIINTPNSNNEGLEPSISDLKIKVEVLNGIGEKGIAQKVARQLKEEGVIVARIDNAGNFDYKETKLVDWRGDQEGKKALALLLNISDENIISYEQKDKTIGFSLVIGQDWQDKIKEL